jgi:RecA/RadA recombinase
LAGDFINAVKLLENRAYLSTGCPELDHLLGNGIGQGVFYLFYGQEESCIDLLLHQLMGNSLTGDEDGSVIYLNCGNYREDKTILDIPSLVYLFKAYGLDPREGLNRIKVYCAFSEEQHEQVIEEIRATIEEPGIVKLLAVHDIAKLFTSQSPFQESYKRIPNLQRNVSRLWQICAAKNIAVVATCRPAKTMKGRIPKPEGGRYVSHLANVIVYLEKTKGLVSSYQAYLLKHSALPPSRALLGSEGERIMGRITKPFKMRFEQELESLRSYRDALRDLETQAAYDAIIKACTREQGAMANTDIPAILDTMLLTAVVNLEKRVELLEELHKNRLNE